MQKENEKTDTSDDLEKKWNIYCNNCKESEKLRELKCCIDDLKCRTDVPINTKKELKIYLSKNYNTLSLFDISSFLSEKYRIQNDITLEQSDEAKILQTCVKMEDKYRNYLSNKIHPVNKSWNSWRNSQTRRYQSEDNSLRASKITYIAFAIELTDGCSGGCSFCGFSAHSLRKNQMSYEENRNNYRTLLKEFSNLAGKEYAKTGVLYWATDPLDHPQYSLYAKDYAEIIGIYPHTTTAIAENNIELIKSIIREQRDYNKKPWNIRISLRSEKAYQYLCENLTLEDRSIIQMNPQYKSRQTSFARTGRAFKNSSMNDQSVHGGTIACMTGFLASLPKNKIQLITPCMANKKNINGYRILQTTVVDESTNIHKTLAKTIKDADEPTINNKSLISFNAPTSVAQTYKTKQGLHVPENLLDIKLKAEDFFKVFENFSDRKDVTNLLNMMLRDGVAYIES
jgi:hypothetical protein